MPLHASGLAEIRISSIEPASAGSFPDWTQRAPFASRIAVPLELGDEPYDVALSLDRDNGLANYRISVQFETSMAISDEGPHIDLLGWKHCTTSWKVLQPHAKGFLLPRPSEAESSCFPDATASEIRSALESALRDAGIPDADARRWLTLAKSIHKAGESPSYIGISKVRVRIEERAHDGWKHVTMLEFLLPLGC